MGVKMSKISDDVCCDLKEFLDGYSKLVILGIGNDIRGDDGLGPYIINRLCDLKESGDLNDIDSIGDIDNIYLINAGSVPENFTGSIKKINPSHILIIDASLMNMKPGDINIVSKENIVNLSVSTHSMSLKYLIKYLESCEGVNNDFKILFVGIEPKSMDLSFDLSDVVKETCDDLIKVLIELF